MPRRIAIELDTLLAGVPADPTEASWESADELEPRTIARLASIASARRWEIIFLTQRSQSSRGTSQIEAQRWLESKGFALPCVYVTPGSRGRIASALHLDLVIDARPENCVDVVTESDARTILVWPTERSSLPPDARRPEINLAKSFGECLDMLTAVDDPNPRSQRAGALRLVPEGLFGAEGLQLDAGPT